MTHSREDTAFRDSELWPVIGAGALEDLPWHTLWDILYPRVWKERSIEAAAETVVPHLRVRCFSMSSERFPAGIGV